MKPIRVWTMKQMHLMMRCDATARKKDEDADEKAKGRKGTHVDRESGSLVMAQLNSTFSTQVNSQVSGTPYDVTSQPPRDLESKTTPPPYNSLSPSFFRGHENLQRQRMRLTGCPAPVHHQTLSGNFWASPVVCLEVETGGSPRLVPWTTTLTLLATMALALAVPELPLGNFRMNCIVPIHRRIINYGGFAEVHTVSCIADALADNGLPGMRQRGGDHAQCTQSACSHVSNLPIISCSRFAFLRLPF
ncbi:hypothetical protein BDW74DRAFT_38096 [Aspergillus multicolor]|uniref:uncharacterized protein n=1 Tax=Aspergillus multicolor TaxID=41759 RepID=UPI003CCCCCB7